MKHEKHPLHQEVEDMLLKYGGFYTFQDIYDGIQVGRFQSFALGESWAVTQICEYPRRTALEIMFVVGRREDLELLHTDIVGWARERGIMYVMANARLGFDRIKLPGWTMVSALYVNDLSEQE